MYINYNKLILNYKIKLDIYVRVRKLFFRSISR